MVEYDGAWSLEWTASSSSPPPEESDMPLVGNGKLALYPSVRAEIDVRRVHIAAVEGINEGNGGGNAVDGFRCHRLVLGDRVASTYTLRASSLRLSMDTGTFRNVTEVVRTTMNSDGTSSESVVGSATHEVYASRQYPFCTIQTIEFRLASTAVSDDDGSSGWCYHEARIPDVGGSEITGVHYGASVLHAEGIGGPGGSPVHVFHGRCSISTMTRRLGEVAFASCYVHDPVEDGVGGAVVPSGYSVQRSDPRVAYNKLQLPRTAGALDSSSGVAYYVHRFHILTVAMSSFDHPSPSDESQRVLLSILTRAARQTVPVSVSSMLRVEHVRQWSVAWETNLIIEGKTGITTNETSALMRLKRHVRYALYNVYSSVREGGNMTGMAALDSRGNVFLRGEMWLMPLLILIKADVVRTALESRFRSLESSMRLAEGQGYRGVRFPYVGDSSDYSTSVYWDATDTVHVFHTAVVAVNAWNYYRVTRDLEWLRTRGYPIIRNVAAFLESVFVQDAQGMYTLPGTRSLTGAASPNNSFALSVAVMALRAAVEATYELSMIARDEWTSILRGVRFSRLSHVGPTPGVLALDAAYAHAAAEDTGVVIPLTIAEPLVLFLPTFSTTETVSISPTTKLNQIRDALTYYTSALSAGTTDTTNSPVNAALLAVGSAVLAQYTRSADDMTTFEQRLDALIDSMTSMTDSEWGNLAFEESDRSRINDVTASGLLLQVLLSGVAGVAAIGGVTDTRFYYEEMRLRTVRLAVMPKYWREIRLSGLTGFRRGTSITVLNDLLYFSTP